MTAASTAMPGVAPGADLAEALQFIRAGRMDRADALCRALVERFPADANAHHLLGLVALGSKRAAEALPRLTRAVALAPHTGHFYSNLGTAQHGNGDTGQAERSYGHALRLVPDQAETAFNKANLLVGSDRIEAAEAWYRRAIELQPERSKYWCSLGTLFMRAHRHLEALRAYAVANAAAGGFFPDTAINQGMTHQRLNQMADALACYERALADNPENVAAYWNRALALLVSGRLEEGWRDYEWRWKLAESAPRPFSQPLWTGEPLNGRSLLLHAEQGLGDTLQFVRYLPRVEGRVILECQPPLRRLLSESFPNVTVVASGDPLPAFDVHLPLLSLPRIFRTTLDSIPADVPYLRAADTASRPAPRPGTLAVGLVWGGDPAHRNDRQRSLGRDALAALLSVPHATFFSLQKGDRGQDLAESVPPDRPVQDLAPAIGDMADTAAFIRQLDVVVTVDTSVAHLAGALGRPVLVMLPFAPDWRWLLERSDSPWYPTAKLFRQTAPGDWIGVVRSVADHLASILSSRRPL